jgi:zinc transport system ATP-binding protein
MNEPLLRCEDLVIGYHGKPLLPPLNLAIERGRVMLVVGRNGAGKSTWLKTVLGLMPPVSGRIRHARSPRPPRFSYVPQHAGLDELLPVRAQTVVGWGRLRGWSFLVPLAGAAEREARQRALVQADAASFAGQPFRDLSGGQRQRILFARFLASDTDVAVLDEPTASMDMASERQTYERLASLARERNMAVVIVTHTIGAALSCADEVLFMDRGTGQNTAGAAGGVVAFGPPGEVFGHPLFKHHFGEVASHGQ